MSQITRDEKEEEEEEEEEPPFPLLPCPLLPSKKKWWMGGPPPPPSPLCSHYQIQWPDHGDGAEESGKGRRNLLSLSRFCNTSLRVRGGGPTISSLLSWRTPFCGSNLLSSTHHRGGPSSPPLISADHPASGQAPPTQVEK